MTPASTTRDRLNAVLFPITALLAAALLFSVQPLAAQRLLPRFGGAPAVWTACLVFFQGTLLLGYLATDRLARVLTPRRQGIAQLTMLALAGTHLPWRLPESIPVASPVMAVFLALAAGVGVPFLALSMMAPLLQRLRAADQSLRTDAAVYRLYAASNAGSLGALLAYPLGIEPNFTGTQIAWGWAVGFALLVILQGLCLVTFRPELRPIVTEAARPVRTAWSTRWEWTWLAFLPACQMTAGTTVLTTEILPVPLLWVLPLALYLLTYILAFAWPWSAAVQRALAGTGVALIGLTLWSTSWRVEWSPACLAALHLGTLSICGLVCHRRLADRQPDVGRLTEYYVWLAVGGWLAAIANAWVAPEVFPALYEYPVTLVLVAATLTPAAAGWEANRSIGLGVAGFVLSGGLAVLAWLLPDGGPAWQAFLWLLPYLPIALWWQRRERLALALACLAATVGVVAGKERADRVVHRVRSFYGAHRITTGTSGKTIGLSHGSVSHGLQFNDPSPRVRRAPLGYYFATSPIGQVLIGRPLGTGTRVGIVGLGIGTLAAYGRPQEAFDFFELDATVADLARDTRFFTQLRDSPAETTVRLGDARLTLADEPDGRFDILVIDAFTGDAIPQHLLTQEAFALYRRKLRPDGLLACHVSSQYVWLAPVVAAGAEANGWDWRIQVDSPITERERQLGKLPSIWMMAGSDPSVRPDLWNDARWTKPRPFLPLLWTDDFSSVWQVWRGGRSTP